MGGKGNHLWRCLCQPGSLSLDKPPHLLAENYLVVAVCDPGNCSLSHERVGKIPGKNGMNGKVFSISINSGPFQRVDPL